MAHTATQRQPPPPPPPPPPNIHKTPQTVPRSPAHLISRTARHPQPLCVHIHPALSPSTRCFCSNLGSGCLWLLLSCYLYRCLPSIQAVLTLSLTDSQTDRHRHRHRHGHGHGQLLGSSVALSSSPSSFFITIVFLRLLLPSFLLPPSSFFPLPSPFPPPSSPSHGPRTHCNCIAKLSLSIHQSNPSLSPAFVPSLRPLPSTTSAPPLDPFVHTPQSLLAELLEPPTHYNYTQTTITMREDLITSAVSFLSDPAIAASPLEKRVAFLQSKNLTQEEIDASLLRAQSALVPAGAAPLPPPVGSLYPPGGYFAPQASPYRYAPQQMPSRARDWRDYFILATVTTTASLTLYHLARRYITPLIAPPTPPQLATDKAAIDAEFAKAFTLLDTLRSDTSALKTAEEERKTRVDAALAEVESVIQSLKDAGKRREDESKRVGDEVRGLRDLIPKALEGQKESQKKALEDLGTELKSLKQLVMNRTGAGRPQFVPGGVAGGTPPLDPSAAAAAASAASAVNGAGGSGGQGQALGSGVGGGGALAAAKMGAPLPFGGMGSRPAIPAWQMAAANKAAAAAVASPAPESQGEGASSG